nr:PAS domain-containing protein [Francisella halioticida]
MNYEAAKLAGLDPDKFIGQDDIEIFGKETGNIYREKDLAVIRGEIINPVDIFINANGEKKAYFIARQKVYNKQTQLIEISGISVDITEHLDAIASIKLKSLR